MSNNFTPPNGDRRSGRDQYGFGNHTGWSYPSSGPGPMFPRFSSSQPMLPDGSRGAYGPWRATEETVLPAPFGFMGFPGQPRSPMQLLLLDSLGRDSAPWVLGPGSFQGSTSTEEDSKLTQDEQKKALKKLKKEMYNPVPKRLTSRLCLYYRDQAPNIVNERAREKEEDGKRCAVCLEDFEPKEIVMLTPCNHMFHEECIVPWVKSNGQCPVCRFALCDRIRGSSSGSFNIPNLPPNNDHLSADLLSILRAMGAM
ncbi:E3 ubiquitin-protein ligase RNF115 [Ricinus communis]|uniref:Protein binding protein, putative n=1 Tax=Ricinus communis TaxID=3988 RepID=B9RW79_RICCO|nr:E3 ubiquitin-protein ligase RNF115 [Ricinus communis]EEF44516.1 protein binding protein, putative [Ricinus communis]|eukprot:XP_025012880.1 E3 ubiquitin-protein ligase RNF115 [Ricinus communis]